MYIHVSNMWLLLLPLTEGETAIHATVNHDGDSTILPTSIPLFPSPALQHLPAPLIHGLIKTTHYPPSPTVPGQIIYITMDILQETFLPHANFCFFLLSK